MGLYDKYFRGNMDVQLAAEFLEYFMPVPELDLAALEAYPTSLIDGKLKETITDVCFKSRFKGKAAYSYIILEHKSEGALDGGSSLAAVIPFQKTKMVLHLEGEGKGICKVIPIAIYHGEKPYSGPRSLADAMVDVPESALDDIDRFEFILIDINRFDENDLKDHPKLRMFLTMLKYAYDDRLQDVFEEMQDVLEELDRMGERMFIISTFTFLMSNNKVKNQEKLDKFALNLEEETRGGVMNILANARAEARSEALVEGEIIGKTKLIVQMLENGVDPEFVRRQAGLNRADFAMLKERYGV